MQAHHLPIIIRLDSQLNHQKVRLRKVGVCAMVRIQKKNKVREIKQKQAVAALN